jgi:hypothetical protein
MTKHTHTYLIPTQAHKPLGRCLNTQSPCEERYRMHSNQPSDPSGWGTEAQQSSVVVARTKAKADRKART